MKLQPLVIEGPHGKVQLSPRFVTGPELTKEPCRFLEVIAQNPGFQGSGSYYPLEEDFQSFCNSIASLSSGGTGTALLTCGSNNELIVRLAPSEVKDTFIVEAEVTQLAQMHSSLTRPFRQQAFVSFWVERLALDRAIALSWLSANPS